MSTIGEQTTIRDHGVASGVSPAHLDHAAPAVYRALLVAAKEANTAAVAAGLDQRIITDYFTPVEKAALAVTETVTLIADRRAGRSLHRDALDALSVQQHAAVRWLAIIINAFNRVAITSHYEMAPEHRSVS